MKPDFVSRTASAEQVGLGLAVLRKKLDGLRWQVEQGEDFGEAVQDIYVGHSGFEISQSAEHFGEPAALFAAADNEDMYRFASRAVAISGQGGELAHLIKANVKVSDVEHVDHGMCAGHICGVSMERLGRCREFVHGDMAGKPAVGQRRGTEDFVLNGHEHPWSLG